LRLQNSLGEVGKGCFENLDESFCRQKAKLLNKSHAKTAIFNRDKSSRERVWNILWMTRHFATGQVSLTKECTCRRNKRRKRSAAYFSIGYGVTSLIENLVQNELVSFRHMTDTKIAVSGKRNGLADRKLFAAENDGVTP